MAVSPIDAHPRISSGNLASGAGAGTYSVNDREKAISPCRVRMPIAANRTVCRVRRMADLARKGETSHDEAQCLIKTQRQPEAQGQANPAQRLVVNAVSK